MKKKVLLAMSGGVDSSIAAVLLKKMGFNVIGITLKLFCYAKTPLQKKACCSLEAIKDARQVCDKLRIKHYVVDCSKEFEKEVIKNFVDEYKRGRTPNPCVRCNQLIKFDWLIKYAKKLGADYVATGHYARLLRKAPNYKLQITNKFSARGGSPPVNWRAGAFGGKILKLKSKTIYKLLMAKDKNKDQTYFLYRLTQEQLKHILFPVGDYAKTQIKQMAKKLGLNIHQKPESQEVCFVPNADLRGFLKTRIYADNAHDLSFPRKRESIQRQASSRICFNLGKIVNTDGEIVGEHNGFFNYTIGQRAPIGGPGPFYVVKLDPRKNIVIVTNKKNDPALYSKKCAIKEINWINKPKLPAKINVKVRYRAPSVSAIINKNSIIHFSKSVEAITPGQSAVFYKNNEVLGGGVIM